MAVFHLTKKEPIQSEREYAESHDEKDSLRHLRAEFIIPTKGDLKSKTLSKSSMHCSILTDPANVSNHLEAQTDEHSNEPCIYLCGNSLGLQPKRTSELVASHLTAWATKGVLGHFTEHEDSTLPPFLHVDDVAAERMAPVVGALPSEVAVMETLTANLHFLMASFYKPTKTRYKIMLEGKAFPSDHYAITSQILHHGLISADALILIQPTSPSVTLTTFQILSIISQHANTTALILLPGIQYYTGQLLNIPRITSHARSLSIPIGWDLAHAVGNVPLHLHDWNVDFAAWCNYKYMNSGPGAIGALFVHSEHGNVDMTAHLRNDQYKPRLSGWWGGQKSTRFTMGSDFIPTPGAKGWQVGNPSALALTAVLASLEIFDMTSMSALREKSIALTSCLESLLLQSTPDTKRPYDIITPNEPSERGAQLSIKLKPGLLDLVLKTLEEEGVVVDERKPDVIRVAPAPLYNTFVEVWEFVKIFKEACATAMEGEGGAGSVMAEGGKREKGWGMVK